MQNMSAARKTVRVANGGSDEGWATPSARGHGGGTVSFSEGRVCDGFVWPVDGCIVEGGTTRIKAGHLIIVLAPEYQAPRQGSLIAGNILAVQKGPEQLARPVIRPGPGD